MLGYPTSYLSSNTYNNLQGTSSFGVSKWSPKLHSMFPQAWGPKVIIAGTSKHIFWNYSNLNLAWSISESTFLKLLQLNVCRHGPIIQAHSMTCRWTLFSMQSVPDLKVYFLETSTPEGPQHTGPTPLGRMFHPFASSLPHLLHPVIVVNDPKYFFEITST